MYYYEQMPNGDRKPLTADEYKDIVFRFSHFHLVKTKMMKVIRRGKQGSTVPKHLLGKAEARLKFGGRGDGSTYRGN